MTSVSARDAAGIGPRIARRLAGIAGAALVLSACAGPMGSREAQTLANARLRRYCARELPCGPVTLAHTQKFNDGWLVEFDAASRKYGVMVHDDGNSDVTVWNKDQASR